MNKIELQTAAVKFMICDLMQQYDDYESYRAQMMDAHEVVAAEFGHDWAEWTASWCTITHMDSMEIALWPVANWDHFVAIARGELQP